MFNFFSRVNRWKMIMGKILLFVGCIPLLASTKEPTEQHTSKALSTDRGLMRSLVSECFAAHNEDNSSQTVISSTAPVTRWFSREESDALAQLLLAIVKAELSQCVLGIVWDFNFKGSVIIDRLSLLPNMKQVTVAENGVINK